MIITFDYITINIIENPLQDNIIKKSWDWYNDPSAGSKFRKLGKRKPKKFSNDIDIGVFETIANILRKLRVPDSSEYNHICKKTAWFINFKQNHSNQ